MGCTQASSAQSVQNTTDSIPREKNKEIKKTPANDDELKIKSGK